MVKGYLSIILHAHLPFVRHPNANQYLEERWFFEGMAESYIPLVAVMLKLRDDHIPARLTVSLSPTLLAMMTDELLIERFRRHLEKLIELGEKEIKRTAGDPVFNYTARTYHRQFAEAHALLYDRYSGNLAMAFKELRDAGVIELMTSAATHGYLPLLAVNPSSVNAQIRVALQQFRDLVGGEPSGLWLPECGYYRGLEGVMAKCGVRYVILETHGLLDADPHPRYGVFAPVRCPGGTAAFGRDGESAKQVWSAQEGYPGDPDYREFYRDIGHDLGTDYIGPYVHDGHIRIDTGYKYYRITGRTEHKEPYQPDWARDKAAIHAGNFMFNRQKQIEYYGAGMDRPPIVVAPYDAELFGHWWYEGPMWLDFLSRKIVCDQKDIEMVTPSQYLDRHGTAEEALPAASSWGYRGFHEVWLNGTNDWMLPWVHWAGRRMRELAVRFAGSNGLAKEALAQAGRELLLVESSDWPFIINNRTSVQYAEQRFKAHLRRFKHIHDSLVNNSLAREDLDILRKTDNLFSSIPVEAWTGP
jgi:1,4-alpha-glucan branching enzyme